MSRVQQLRAKFEASGTGDSQAPTPPRRRTDIQIPPASKLNARTVYRLEDRVRSDVKINLTRSQAVLLETVQLPDIPNVAVNASPLSPVQDRIRNFEGRLLAETKQVVKAKVQNEKFLINRMDAVVRRQKSVKEKVRRELEEAEKRKRWCVVCFEAADMGVMIEAECKHWYCGKCLIVAFEIALQSRMEFRCCRQSVSITLLTAPPSRGFVSRYSELILELSTPNPLYCHNSRCSAFLPPTLIFGPDIAHCVRCYSQTCRHCRDRAHKRSVCSKDESMNLAKDLQQRSGWKSCPTCKNVIERSEGCLHITCRCMTEFCYRCGGLWKDCESSCAELPAPAVEDNADE